MRALAPFLLTPLLAAAVFALPARAEKVNLTLLLTSDIYNFDANSDGRGGFARLNAVVKAERAKSPNVIYAHAGDMLSPSLLSGFDKGANTVALTNLAPPDFFVPGNHEFDFGPQVFRDRMKELKTTLLAANLQGADGKLPEGVSASRLLTVGGLKVGVLGAITDDAREESSPGPDYTFADPVAAAEAEAAALRKQGADFIVAIVHTDRAQDEALLASHAVDVVLSGHDHNLDIQYDGRSALAESMSEAAYVTAVDIAADVQEKDGKRSVTWWPNFRVIDSATVTPDPETQAAVTKYADQLSKELDVEIGVSATALDSRKASVRGGETAIGDLIADALRDAVGADVAITNGGGIRGNKQYPAGAHLTRKDVFTELPFGNKMVKIELTGDGILAALENGLSQVENGAGRFPQVSGLTVTTDLAKPAGSRVVSVMVNGKPLDKAAVYSLATNDFMQAGGDGYAMFTPAKVLIGALGGKLMASAVIDYIAAKKNIAPAIEGRIAAAK